MASIKQDLKAEIKKFRENIGRPKNDYSNLKKKRQKNKTNPRKKSFLEQH